MDSVLLALAELKQVKDILSGLLPLELPEHFAPVPPTVTVLPASPPIPETVTQSPPSPPDTDTSGASETTSDGENGTPAVDPLSTDNAANP